jgi:hypothetical protein
MATTYPNRQTMVSLSFLAYVDETVLPQPTQQQMRSDIESALPKVSPALGPWSIVWGPVSYTVPGAVYPENMMYVAKLTGSAETQYGIAIRGTNGKVLLDWLLEDFDIVQTVPWSSFAPGAPGNISESTSIDLTVLLNMVDALTNQTLVAFLQSEIASAGSLPINLCVTGHSLGGVLASAVALYLRDAQKTWDPALKATVTTIHFAAPTAGDSDFAAHSDQQFTYSGTCPLPNWLDPNVPVTSASFADCVRSSYDIAPLVWNAGDMGHIEKLYSGQSIWITPPPGTAEIISAIVKATGKNAYTQPQATQATLQAPFIPLSSLPSGVDHWLAEAEMQHVAYPSVLQVTGLPAGSPLPAIAVSPRKASAGAA